jgi:sulfite reductase beta subunit-like hemoprotein
LIGFNIYAGGKIGSSGPVAGFDLDIFVRPHEVLDIAKGIFELYSDMGKQGR